MHKIRILGRDKDRVELTLGDDDLHLITTQRGDDKRYQTVMITGRGLMKIALRAALHLGYRLEKIHGR